MRGVAERGGETVTLRQAQDTTTGQSVILGGWTLTITPDGVELTAPKGEKIDLMSLKMTEQTLKVGVK